MDFEACLKIHTLIAVQHKSINLGQNNDPSQHDLLRGGVKLSTG